MRGETHGVEVRVDGRKREDGSPVEMACFVEAINYRHVDDGVDELPRERWEREGGGSEGVEVEREERGDVEPGDDG